MGKEFTAKQGLFFTTRCCNFVSSREQKVRLRALARAHWSFESGLGENMLALSRELINLTRLAGQVRQTFSRSVL